MVRLSLRVEEVASEPSSQDILISGMFSKTNFLDLIQNLSLNQSMEELSRRSQGISSSVVHKKLSASRQELHEKIKVDDLAHTRIRQVSDNGFSHHQNEKG